MRRRHSLNLPNRYRRESQSNIALSDEERLNKISVHTEGDGVKTAALESINRLGFHLAKSVVHYLVEEVKKEEESLPDRPLSIKFSTLSLLPNLDFISSHDNLSCLADTLEDSNEDCSEATDLQRGANNSPLFFAASDHAVKIPSCPSSPETPTWLRKRRKNYSGPVDVDEVSVDSSVGSYVPKWLRKRRENYTGPVDVDEVSVGSYVSESDSSTSALPLPRPPMRLLSEMTITSARDSDSGSSYSTTESLLEGDSFCPIEMESMSSCSQEDSLEESSCSDCSLSDDSGSYYDFADFPGASVRMEANNDKMPAFKSAGADARQPQQRCCGDDCIKLGRTCSSAHEEGRSDSVADEYSDKQSSAAKDLEVKVSPPETPEWLRKRRKYYTGPVDVDEVSIGSYVSESDSSASALALPPPPSLLSVETNSSTRDLKNGAPRLLSGETDSSTRDLKNGSSNSSTESLEADSCCSLDFETMSSYSQAESFEETSDSDCSVSDDSSSYEDFADFSLPAFKNANADSCRPQQIRNGEECINLPGDATSPSFDEEEGSDSASSSNSVNEVLDDDSAMDSGLMSMEGAARSPTESVVRLRQSRMVKALDSEGPSCASSHTDTKSMESELTNRYRFYSTTHKSALCFVDISGFTKLCKSLELELLSQTINNYFQMIVDEVESFGGDIVKFAGDALIAEWQVQGPSASEGSNAVLMASMCAATIVSKCCDFPVKSKNVQVSTLNVHCGIGFGSVVGAHVGDIEKRMEYLIFGKALRQVADAMTLAKEGEVIASPEALKKLAELVEFESSVTVNDSPKVISYKSKKFFEVKSETGLPTLVATRLDSILNMCKDWEVSSLQRLQLRMSKYTHPVVMSDEFSSEQYPENHEKGYQSTAELRDVFTVFIRPECTCDLLGEFGDSEVGTQVLQEIMLIVNSELVHFKGQLRQIIVDDKGLVVIANFGLRGSTFPNMIEERALPGVKNIKKLLKTELGIDCKLGATFGKAYCGIVGGNNRHEYAILGPSINLAARLMQHSKNPGLLVDEAVMMKASCYPFQSLAPIEAKGYSKPVDIFRPGTLSSKSWKDTSEVFVGRGEELKILDSMTEDTIKSKRSSIALITAPYGYGKSSLLAHAVEGIESVCKDHSKRCHVSRTMFCEEDSFEPFSIVRHLFLDVLVTGAEKDRVLVNVKTIGHNTKCQSRELMEAKLYATLLQVCMEAKIPLNYVEIICSLIFTKDLADIEKWSDRSQKMARWMVVARFIVSAFLHITRQYDLILLALDDVSDMDEMSWKILENLYSRADNVLVLSACRNAFDLNICPDFWEELVSFRTSQNRFNHMAMGLLSQDDILKITGKLLTGEQNEGICEADEKIGEVVHSLSNKHVGEMVYNLSGGNPFIATQILQQLYNETMNSSSSLSEDPAGELLLNRLDSLPANVRLHLTLGATLGNSFKLVDVATVLERYHEMDDPAIPSYSDQVRKSFNEAVQNGILVVTGENSFTFSHRLWRENVLKLTLDGWKHDMLNLLLHMEEKRSLSIEKLTDLVHDGESERSMSMAAT